MSGARHCHVPRCPYCEASRAPGRRLLREVARQRSLEQEAHVITTPWADLPKQAPDAGPPIPEGQGLRAAALRYGRAGDDDHDTLWAALVAAAGGAP